MNYFNDTLIIDDQVEEAYELSELFAQRGSNPIILKPEHVSRELAIIPKLVCCDINLNGTDDDQNFKTIAGLLKKIYSENKKGIYIFIAWTSHKNKLKALKKFIQADVEICQPLDFIAMGKEDYKDNPQKLERKINSILKNKLGLKACLIWNSIIREANNETFINLSNLAKDTNIDLLTLFGGLASVNLGENRKKDETIAITKPLSYILRDNIEKKLIYSDSQKKLDAILQKMPESPLELCNDEIKSKTNSILHINSATRHSKIIPGDVIKISDKELKSLLKNTPPSKLKEDLIKGTENPDNVELALLEITPDCDYSNIKTYNVNKFALTYLIPNSKTKKLDKEYYKHTKIKFMYNGEEYIFIVDCRYIFSIIPKKKLIKDRIFSLRENLFTSFRQYVYTYNSRIGTISF
ncbi:MAG: hypothetical protein SO314_06445 [Alphaproteobacteria bacterium]|nr:hypothetical protein [Alphaproteobacteria bacterium]